MRKRKWWIALLLLLVVLGIWLAWGNTALVVTEYTVSSECLPGNFEGFRIAQISDLHNAEFGEENEKLLALLRNSQPDIIVLTGDLVDSRNTDIQVALTFAREAVKIAPCYFVTGNHETRIAEYGTLEQGLTDAGVTVLHGEVVIIQRDDQQIRLIGLDDYSYYPGNNGEACIAVMLSQLDQLPTDGFDILLQHRPELFSRFQNYDIELMLSGHAHGGQIRVPFLGGVYAPDQGFWPEYDGGLYKNGEQQMVVSRGLGNSQIPLRINNRPELVIINLTSQ